MPAHARLPDPFARRQRAGSRAAPASIVGAVAPPVPPAIPEAGEIGLGTCVRVSLSGTRSQAHMTEEGVVIEVVAAREPVRSARVFQLVIPIAEEPRYVIQCWSRRVLRHASRLAVVSL